MPDTSSTFTNSGVPSGPPKTNNLTDKISDSATQLKDKIADVGQMASNKIDENRGAAASSLQSAAESLHDTAEHLPGVETVKSVTHGAADTLNATADYVRSHDVNRMIADVEGIVKRNPGPALLVAAVIGFLTARAFSRD